jgi:hypothetical protein
MEQPPMRIHWQNQYCENHYAFERNQQIHSNSHQNPNVILQRKKNHPKIHAKV